MGLDMYLYAERYVGGYDFSESKDTYRQIVEILDMADLASRDTPSLTVRVPVAYWRKANQVHNWFVQNVQGGEDDCEPHSVSPEALQELVDACRLAIAAYQRGDHNMAVETLPPTSGFYFGSTEVDEGYLYELESTIDQISPLLPPALATTRYEFYYQSSW